MQPTTVLSIAGSDSGGGAGIQADIRTLSAFEVHATTAVTAVTAQNTVVVSAVHTIDPQIVEDQVRTVLSDFDVRAVKTGMLAHPRTVEVVAHLAAEGALRDLVVDPVLVSSNGHALMQEGGVHAYREHLLPHALLVTPNLREAAVLCDRDVTSVRTVDDMVELAQALLDLGPQWVLVKGGHFAVSTYENASPDVLVARDEVIIFEAPRIVTVNDHGTGCSLSSAIAAGLALGRTLPESVRDAKSFVLAALEGAATWHLGQGRGPIDHLGWNA